MANPATLPVLLSIPHGGLSTPVEIKKRVALTSLDILNESDAYTQTLYHLGPRVQTVVRTNIARAFVDVNRAPDDLPPRNPDGAVKSLTSYRKPVFEKKRVPDAKQTAALLQKYHTPYHRKIERVLKKPGLALALDCHSMAPVGPPMLSDAGQKRPMICIGNAHGASCLPGMAEKMAVCFRKAFCLSKNEVTINRPFAGGYLTRHYGMNPLPWLQVEMSRGLYMIAPWFDRNTLHMQKKRLFELRACFENALLLFFK